MISLTSGTSLAQRHVVCDDEATTIDFVAGLAGSGVAIPVTVGERTALHFAALACRPAVVRQLLAMGTSREARDDDDCSPWDLGLGTWLPGVRSRTVPAGTRLLYCSTPRARSHQRTA
jgi:hypothetical protein